MTVKTVKLITTYYEGEKAFYILRDEENHFWAIEDKYVDENGHMKQEINGITGLRSKTPAEAIQKAHERIAYQKLIAQGMDKEEAIIKVMKGEI